MYLLKKSGFSNLLIHPKYQKNIEFLVRQFLPFGQIPTFEDSNNGLLRHYKQLYRNAMFHSENPQVREGLEFLRQRLDLTEAEIDTNPDEGNDNVFSFSFLMYSNKIEAVQYSPKNPTFFPIDSGLAFLRDGVGDEDLYLVLNNKPFDSPHRLPDDGSFEMWGYGACLIHNPGYLGWGKEPNHSYNRDSRAHNTVKIYDSSNVGRESPKPFPTTITSSKMDIVEANVSEKYGNMQGSFHRSILFSKNYLNSPRYFIMYDRITTDNEVIPVEWFLHGNSEELSLDGNDAQWNIERWRGEGEKVKLNAHIIAPGLKLTRQQEEFPAYITGCRAEEKAVAYIKGEKLGGINVLTVLCPTTESMEAIDFQVEEVNERIYSCSMGDSDKVMLSLKDEDRNLIMGEVQCEAQLLFVRQIKEELSHITVHRATSLVIESLGIKISTDKPFSAVLDIENRNIRLQVQRNFTRLYDSDIGGFTMDFEDGINFENGMLHRDEKALIAANNKFT